MRWIGFRDGENLDGPSSSSTGTNYLRQLRLAWIQSLVQDGEYDSADALSHALDKMIRETKA